MIEQHAAEAATIEAMHTGDYSAPDLEYTPITDPLPAVVSGAEVERLRNRVAELEDIINRKWGNPFMHMRDSAVFDALDALAAFWHIIILPLAGPGVLMRLYDPTGLEKAAEFTGALRDVVLQAETWASNVRFTVLP